jgi:hypothetical protein
MPFLDNALTKGNPLIKSLFIQDFEGEGDFPPVITFRITDASENRITDDGDNRITDN